MKEHERRVTITYWVEEHYIGLFGENAYSLTHCKAYESREAADRFIQENTKNLPEGRWYEVHEFYNCGAN